MMNYRYPPDTYHVMLHEVPHNYYDKFYFTRVLPYAKKQFIKHVKRNQKIMDVLTVLMVHNDVNRFTYIMDACLDKINITDLLGHTLEYRFFIFFKIVMQNYARLSDITPDICAYIGQTHDLNYVNVLRKTCIIDDEWQIMIYQFMSYEYENNVKSSDSIIISMLSEVRIVSPGYLFEHRASLNIVKYLETRITDINWNALLWINKYQDVKHYAMFKLNNVCEYACYDYLFYDHNISFLLNCIDTPYKIFNEYEYGAISIKDFVQRVPCLRNALIDRKKQTFILSNHINQLAHDIKFYDIHITNIICDYAID